MKLLNGSSALTRTSMEWPDMAMSAWATERGAPKATRIISATRSWPVIISVTGCSTWMRVFISRKAKVPRAGSKRYSSVPAPR